MVAKTGGKMIDSADTLEGQKFLRNRSISHRFQDKYVYVFYAEIQDGWQKWRENYFWKKPPVNSGDALAIKNFDQIAVSHTVSQINEFLRFMQKFKMAAKNGRKTIFGKTRQLTLGIPCTVFEIFRLFYFPLKSKMAAISCED